MVYNLNYISDMHLSLLTPKSSILFRAILVETGLAGNPKSTGIKVKLFLKAALFYCSHIFSGIYFRMGPHASCIRLEEIH